MTNKELGAKLNTLKNAAPNREWLETNRVLLLAQISNSGAADLPAWRVALINFSSFASAAVRPATAFASMVIMLLVGGVYSHRFFAAAKPNDSLYIARIISEQVKLSTTFNSATRDKLAVQYASEHAKDITAVLANPEFNQEENQEQVAKLNNSFKSEVETVKKGISRIAAQSPVAPAKTEGETEVGMEVTIADNEKDGQGIQVQEEAPVEPVVPVATATPVAASSSTPVIGAEGKVEVEASDAEKILDEAQQLFEAKDYEKASEKLQEVDKIIKK